MQTYQEFRAQIAESYREYFRALLTLTKGNVTQAASIAQFDRANFQRRLRKLGIKAKDFRP